MLTQHQSQANRVTWLNRPWLGILLLLMLVVVADGQQPARDDTRFTPPPGEESKEVREKIDQASSSLHSGRTVSELLSDDKLLSIRSFPRFRELIKKNAPATAVTMAPASEPGEALQVRGIVQDSQGRPVKGALIYAVHTSAKGWYSDKAAHFSGNSGDVFHARLFVFLKSDEEGRYSFRTIRPGGYPATDLPAHIHVHIDTAGAQPYVTEVVFDDDPRLTPKWRESSKQAGYVISTVKKDADKVQQVVANFQLK